MSQGQYSLDSDGPRPNECADYVSAARRSNTLVVKVKHLQLLLLITVILMVRANDLNYRTVFVDEAIYIRVGDEARAGIFDQHATAWVFGSYLYPVVVSIFNQSGGIEGVRLLSAITSVITAIAIYFTAQLLFDDQAALWSMFLFGLSGISISVGALGVYDALALPFLAIAFHFMVRAILIYQFVPRSRLYLVIASLCVTLATLSKYIAFAYIPVLVIVAVSLCLARGLSWRTIIQKVSWAYYVLPMLLLLGIYGLVYASDLMEAFGVHRPSYIVDRQLIFQEIWIEAGFLLLVAYIGLLLGYWHPYVKLRFHSLRGWAIYLIWIHLLLISLLVLPITHLVTSNARALSKHLVYGLVFLSPFIGYVFSRVIHWLFSFTHTKYLSVISFSLALLVLSLFVKHGLDRNWGFQNSWPNAVDVVDYLISQPLNDDDKILASGSWIYEYYLNHPTQNRSLWINTWRTDFEHEGLRNVEAMQAAIEDCMFEYIVLDNHYTPEVDQVLAPVALSSGYTLTFETVETLSTGVEISTRVYQVNPDDECTGGVTNSM